MLNGAPDAEAVASAWRRLSCTQSLSWQTGMRCNLFIRSAWEQLQLQTSDALSNNLQVDKLLRVMQTLADLENLSAYHFHG
eukprot:328022-Amphidinium_carterae.1